MTEVGARPAVSPLRRKLLNGVRMLFTPLLPDDYIELIDPLWSTRELRGRVERIEPQADGAVTVHVRPGFEWTGHRPGQYVRFGVVVDGRHHWRAYSLTSEPDAQDGLVSITPKLVEGGVVSTFLARTIRVGAVVRLGEVEGTFTLPVPRAEQSTDSSEDSSHGSSDDPSDGPADNPSHDIDAPLLFVTAGSGITPVMSMLRHLHAEGRMRDVVHIHSARSREHVIFGEALDDLDRRESGLRVHIWESSKSGHITADDIASACPDWKERQTYASGPGELLDQIKEYWDGADAQDLLHVERFQPKVGGSDSGGDGGTIRFPRRDIEAESPAGTPILEAGEEAGIDMPFGCRMGVCHTCVLRVREGSVRDLRTGDVQKLSNEMVRTCINAAEGPVVLDH